MTKRYRIKNHGRFITFVVVTMIMITCLVNMILGFDRAQSMAKTDYMNYEICSGDTLWNLAETYMSNESDTRKAVYLICKANDINASDLQVGMTIQIPVSNY